MGRDTSMVQCGICEKLYSSAGFHTHLKHSHDLTVDEYVEEYGEYRKKKRKRKKRKKESEFVCKICGEKLVSDRQLSFHVRKEHDLEKEQYVLEYIFNGEHPTCECGCGKKVEILSYKPYKRGFISGHNSKGENNPMYGKTHNEETKKKMKRKKFQSLTERLGDRRIKPLFDFDDYKGVEFSKPFTSYKFKCVECEKTFENDLRKSRVPSCPYCVNNGISKQHLEIREFLRNLNVNFEENVRDIFDENFELDFHISEEKVAIEFNGLYWHSEASGEKGKNYHLKKTEKCEEKGIHLIHVFEDEWSHKKEVVKSRLMYILNEHEGKRIGARECKVREVNPSDKNQFLEKHHIQGQDRSSEKIGLYYNEELVSVMTFSSPRAFQSADYEENTWEISRYCSHKDKVLLGSFGKLFSYFLNQFNYNSIITYADRRYTTKLSNVYENYGFELKNNGTPNYWYTDYNVRKHRFNFTKNKILEKYDGDPELTEWENMRKMGYDRIWDCGHLKYIWKE